MLIETKAKQLLPKLHPVAARERLLVFIVIIVPILGTICAAQYVLQFGFGYKEFVIFFVFYFLGEIGAEVGHHRYFSHRSFEAGPTLKYILVALASASGKGSVFEFAAIHRRHHHFSDKPGDPHSPHSTNKNWVGKIKSFFHGYIGWLFTFPYNPSEHAWVIDLYKDPIFIKWGNKNMYYFWLIIGLILPGIVGVFVFDGLFGFFQGLLWGGLVRLFFEQHSAFTINTLSHLFGAQPFKTKDKSRNNFILALLTFGVGWHNNHHAFPYTAYNQFKWWQIDVCGWVIWLFEKTNLLSNPQFPSPEKRLEKLQTT